jgi:hypothetical protein
MTHLPVFTRHLLWYSPLFVLYRIVLLLPKWDKCYSWQPPKLSHSLESYKTNTSDDCKDADSSREALERGVDTAARLKVGHFLC